MRRSKEWNMPQGKKPAVFVIDVAEIAAPVSAPSSSSSSSSQAQAEPKHSNNHNHSNNHAAAEQSRSRDSPVPSAATAAATQASVSSPTRTPSLTVRPDQGVSEASQDAAAVVDSKMAEKSGDAKLGGEIIEDAPHAAWYRIIYKVRISETDRQRVVLTVLKRETVNSGEN